jgi:SAM domain (Sterile alpha motif)
MDIVVWLRSLGLAEYEADFRKNHIDEVVLPNLTAEDLKDLGVGSIGHRRKLLDAIALLRGDAAMKAPPPEASSVLPKPPQDTGAADSRLGIAARYLQHLTCGSAQWRALISNQVHWPGRVQSRYTRRQSCGR